MHFSNGELRQLAGQASSIWEREKTHWESGPAPNADLLARRLKRWRAVAAADKEPQFRARLAWDGLDEPRLQRLLGPVSPAEGAELPSWTLLVNDWLAQVEAAKGETLADRCLDDGAPLPFQELLVHLVRSGRARLQQRLQVDPPVTAWVFARLERALLEKLVETASPTLNLEFSIFRAARRSPFTRFVEGQQNGPSTALYRQFLAELAGGKLLALCREYAVLSRLLASSVEWWVVATAEFLERLTADLPAIQAHFDPERPLGRLVGLQSHASDPHNFHRGVHILEFGNCLKLVYKPRPLGLDAAFGELLEWLGRRGSHLTLKSPAVLERPGYGWVEFIPHQPCTDRTMGGRYFQRVGMLLCLVYLLEGTDCHVENIIACGEQPVLIDLETLFHPRIRPTAEQARSARVMADILLDQSVTRTGLIPRWEWGKDGQGYDVSGLGWRPQENRTMKSRRWQHVNSDEMKIAEVNIRLTPQAHVPMLGEEPLVARDFMPEILAGFEAQYRQIMALKAELLDDEHSPLHPFRPFKSRFIFRNTRTYFSLMDAILQPQAVRDGVDYSIELDALSRAYMEDEKPLFWPFLRAEAAALARLDVPYLTLGVGEEAFIFADGSRTAPTYLVGSSFSQVRQKIAALSEEGLRQQLDVIRVSMEIRFEGEIPLPRPAGRAQTGRRGPDDPDAFVRRGIELAEIFQKRAVRDSEGRGASWIGLKYVPSAGVSQIISLKDNLHSGSCGIALFLTAAAEISGREEFYELARQGLQPLADRLDSTSKIERFAIEESDIGGGIGYGSMIYALSVIGRLRNDPWPLALAERIAALMTPERLRDGRLDAMDGVAGALLGLLALYERVPSAELREKLELCGRLLLERRLPVGEELLGWATAGERALAGFSHGAAGIAYALLRLYGVTGDAAYREAAVMGIRYENTLFAPERGNWPNLLNSHLADERRHYEIRWCHGAPGIGLARLAGLLYFGEDEVCRDIHVALETSMGESLSELDHVCCGNFGRLEFVLAAARRFGRADLLAYVHRQTGAIMARAERSGSFHLPVLQPGPGCHDYQLAFFHGIAGVGYQLLRTAYPERLPSVLSWAP